MILGFSQRAWEDYLYWQGTNSKTLKRINNLIRDTVRDPHAGNGKPEQLRGGLNGYWSRRIDTEHRIVYKATEDMLYLLQLRHHYDR